MPSSRGIGGYMSARSGTTGPTRDLRACVLVFPQLANCRGTFLRVVFDELCVLYIFAVEGLFAKKTPTAAYGEKPYGD